MPHPTGPVLGMNAEPAVSNQTCTRAHQQDAYQRHQQRLREIASGARRSSQGLGDKWRVGPLASKPVYPHLRRNLKRAQMQNERFDEIERENRILLDKMHALMSVGPHAIDPTEGTLEFRPGVRLNRFQVPVIDHGISMTPKMRGAARPSESLNWGVRRRELERITHENRGIVHRIQERKPQYSAEQWTRRSDEHDQILMRIRRPATAHDLPIPIATAQQLMSNSMRSSTSQGSSRRQRPRKPYAPATTLLRPANMGDDELLVGLCSGFVKGATLLVQPNEPVEEQLLIAEVSLRRDGLLVRLHEPCTQLHPAGVYVHVYPEAERLLHSARAHLDGSQRLLDDEITARIE